MPSREREKDRRSSEAIFTNPFHPREKETEFFGSGRGSVGRAVASDTRGLRFDFSHRHKFIYIEHLFTVNCVLEKTKIKKKRPGMAQIFKKKKLNLISVLRLG